jgi:hypothetical protein
MTNPVFRKGLNMWRLFLFLLRAFYNVLDFQCSMGQARTQYTSIVIGLFVRLARLPILTVAWAVSKRPAEFIIYLHAMR